jgi:hypothetical protein
MKAFDQTSSLFWLFVSGYVFIICLNRGIGTIHNPGPYFMAFGASGVMVCLSVICFIQSTFTKEKEDSGNPFSGKMWHKVIFVLICMFLYAKMMSWAGYLICTFCLMSLFLLMARKGKWWWSPVGAGLITLITYQVFSKWLSSGFPMGLFGY